MHDDPYNITTINSYINEIQIHTEQVHCSSQVKLEFAAFHHEGITHVRAEENAIYPDLIIVSFKISTWHPIVMCIVM